MDNNDADFRNPRLNVSWNCAAPLNSAVERQKIKENVYGWFFCIRPIGWNPYGDFEEL